MSRIEVHTILFVFYDTNVISILIEKCGICNILIEKDMCIFMSVFVGNS